MHRSDRPAVISERPYAAEDAKPMTGAGVDCVKPRKLASALRGRSPHRREVDRSSPARARYARQPRTRREQDAAVRT